MGVLADQLAVFESATYWAATAKLGKGFGQAYPADAAKVVAYVEALDAGNLAAPPPTGLATKHAQGLVGMLAALAAQAAPPPAATYGARTRPGGALIDRTTSDFRYGLNSGVAANEHIHDTPDYGFGVMGYWGAGAPAPATGTVTVENILAERIGTTPPHMDGQGEAGLWYGQQVAASNCLGHGTWMGGWLGAQCRDSTITDHTFAVLNADGTLGKLPGVGLYIEHCTRRVVIEHCTIKAHGTGINWEWTYADGGSLSTWLAKEYPGYPAGEAGSLDITFRYCDIESDTVGVFLDAGACGLTMHDCKITAPVGIKRNTVLAMPTKPHAIDYNSIEFHGTTLEQTHTNPMGALAPRAALDPHTTRMPQQLPTADLHF